MARRLGIGTVAVVLCWLAGEAPSPAQVPPPHIVVLVYNRAHMRQETLRDGIKVGKEILARAGMASLWLECLSESGDSVQECSNPHGEVKLVLTVIKRWKGALSDDSRLGLALQNPPGFGTYCYIFEDKLDELVRDTHVNPSRLLGNAMAHEIGHLLKGSNSHSTHGIMSAQWYRDDMEAVRRGALAFTPEDIVAMRTRFSGVSQSSTTLPLPKPRA